MSAGAMPDKRMNRFHAAIAVLLGVVGASFFNLQPLFFAAAQPVFELSDAQIGGLAASELAGVALVSLWLTIFAGELNYRAIAVTGLVFIIIGNVASLFAETVWQLMSIRFLTGFLGDGVVYICAILLLGSTGSPTRLFGLLVFVNMIITAVTINLLPGLLADQLWPGLLILLAGMAVVALLFAVALTGSARSTRIFDGRALCHRQAVYLLLAICAFAMNLGVVWSYAERLGARAGLGLGEISVYLSYSLPLQAGGALFAALVGTRLGRARPFALVVLCQLLAIFLLQGAAPGSQWWFFAGISLWGFSWNLGIAYLLGLVAAVDAGQRLLMLVPCMEAIGISLGPAIAAAFISDSQYSPVYITAIIALIISSGLFIRVLSRSRGLGND